MLVALPVSSVGLIALLYLLYTRTPPSESASALVSQQTTSVRQRAEEIDSDGDGLMDWEEVLWNTNNNNPDTDGDGTLDGDEVRLARSPSVAGPNDFVLTREMWATSTESAVAGFGSSSLTMTESVSREIMGSYLSARQLGHKLEPEAQQQLVDAALARTVTTHSAPRVATSTITEVPASAESSAVYIGNVLKIFSETVVLNRSQELALVGRYVQNSDITAKAELDVAVERNIQCAVRMQSLKVPTDALELHVRLVNSIYEYAHTVEGMGGVREDPMRGALAAGHYDSSVNALKGAVKAFHEYRASHRSQ